MIQRNVCHDVIFEFLEIYTSVKLLIDEKAGIDLFDKLTMSRKSKSAHSLRE